MVTNGIRPETELLLNLSRTHLDVPATERITLLLRIKIDWNFLISSAIHHGVLPLLYKNLNTRFQTNIADHIIHQLRSLYIRNAVYNLGLLQELSKILTAFHSEDTLVIPFKGPALAEIVYGDVCLRKASVDLDLLIKRQDYLQAKNILFDIGYHPAFELSPSKERRFINHRHHLVFIKDKGVMLELHWDIGPRYFSTINIREIINNAKPEHFANLRISHFCPEDLILLLAIHGAKDYWGRLSLVCDITETIYKYDSVDWNSILKKARKIGYLRILLLGLFLAHRLLSAPLPSPVLKRIESDKRVKTLAEKSSRRLFANDILYVNKSRFISYKYHYFLNLREKPPDKFKLLWRKAAQLVHE